MKYFIFSLFFGAFLQSHAQQDSVVIPDPEQFSRSSYFYINTPYAATNISFFPQLGQALRNQNIDFPKSSISSYFTTYGVGQQIKRFKAGTEVSIGLERTYSKKVIRIISSNSSFSFNTGYAVFKERNTMWFANIGIGRVESNLSIYNDSSPQTVNFNTLTTNPIVGRLPNLVHRNTFLEVSTERLYRPKRPVSLSPSFKIGYRFGINKTTWKTEDNATLLNAPTDRIHQVFFQSIFVIGRNSQQKVRKPKQSDASSIQLK